MATLMTITITFDDGASLTTTEAHEMTVDMAKQLKALTTASIAGSNGLTTTTYDFSAADALTVSIT